MVIHVPSNDKQEKKVSFLVLSYSYNRDFVIIFSYRVFEKKINLLSFEIFHEIRTF